MKGHSEVKMFYRYGGSFMGPMTIQTMGKDVQSEKLEFVVNQDCWYNSETNFADIILPACTSIERDDVGEWGAAGGYTHHASNGCNHRIVVRQQKCIEPLWESKSDYQIFTLLSERLGKKRSSLDGKDEIGWI
jgi:trimethylamine-N-oxide reductase (cytochrome c)